MQLKIMSATAIFQLSIKEISKAFESLSLHIYLTIAGSIVLDQ